MEDSKDSKPYDGSPVPGVVYVLSSILSLLGANKVEGGLCDRNNGGGFGRRMDDAQCKGPHSAYKSRF